MRARTEIYQFIGKKSGSRGFNRGLIEACFKFMTILTMTVLGLLVFWPLELFASELVLDDYANGISSRWESKSFKGLTRYSAGEEAGRRCIRADSKGSASALYYRVRFDLRKYPILRWSWKVDGVIPAGDARKKEGDDYAARIYVVFPSVLFWQTKALNYIWANKLTKGDAVQNPFTANAVMIAVQSGNENAGRWMDERRSIFDDFRRYFGSEPPEAEAVAIMTDTDNTGAEAGGCYGVIKLLGKDSELR